MVILIGNRIGNLSSSDGYKNELFCISRSDNVLWKGFNSSLRLRGMGK